MRKIDIRTTFKKDYKRVLKQGWNEIVIDKVINELQTKDVLDESLQDHQLNGDMRFKRECHVFADLVIVYQRDDNILTLYRIGRHQDVYKKY